jgi:ATP-dependent DNA helicase RecQ
MSSLAALQNNFSHNSFRDKQEEIIEDALIQMDQFIILPTGSGKSICFQLPALIQNGITIVISPLKSLILDQVANLEKKKYQSRCFLW